jgi:hypothetical protein
MTLAYGFEVDAPTRYGPAVEIALEDLRDAATRGADLTAVRRRAELVGALDVEIHAVLAEAGAAATA